MQYRSIKCFKIESMVRMHYFPLFFRRLLGMAKTIYCILLATSYRFIDSIKLQQNHVLELYRWANNKFNENALISVIPPFFCCCCFFHMYTHPFCWFCFHLFRYIREIEATRKQQIFLINAVVRFMQTHLISIVSL